MRLILLGAPGAGKGTQAALLREKYKLEHISTGDIFRQNLREKTPLGLEAKKYMDIGHLVPDKIVMEMVGERLPDDGFMLDGFPRTVAQTEFLEMLTKIDAVILFKVDDDEIVQRLSSRVTCRDCGKVTNVYAHKKCPDCGGELYQRDDDHEDTIRNRLRVFHEQTEALVEYYRKRGLLTEIDAIGTPDEIFDRVIETLEHD